MMYLSFFDRHTGIYNVGPDKTVAFDTGSKKI